MSVISVRVDKKVRETLERAGISVSKEVKEFLDDLAWRADLKERVDRLDKVVEKMPSSKRGFGAKSVREDRESH